MNKLIRQQLDNVTVTNIEYTLDSEVIIIPKTIKVLNTSMKKGEYYKIRLFDFITNPPPSSTLASNWNNGNIPKYSEYIVEVINNMSKMLQINGVAVEDNTSQFVGWLPHDGFEIIEKL